MTEAEINQFLEIYKKHYPKHYKALCDAIAESVSILCRDLRNNEEVQDKEGGE